MVDRQAELRRRLLAMFALEAESHLRTIDSELAALKQPESPDAVPARIESLFRAVHTLKGAARSVGFTQVEDICQRGETLLSDLRRGRVRLDGALWQTLRDHGDAAGRAVAAAQVASPAPPAGPAPPASPPRPATPDRPPAPLGAPPAPPPALAPADSAGPTTASAVTMPAVPAPAPERLGSDSVRVEARNLNRLNRVAEELLLPRLAAAERRDQARTLSERLGRLRDLLNPGLGAESRQARAELDSELREVEQLARRLTQSLSRDQGTLHTLVEDLSLAVRDIRMMPVADLLALFPPMIRDLSREVGREVQWEAEGGELQIDRRVVDLIRGPLIHVVRNAVDHGLEPPEVRIAAGKPPAGRIVMRVTQGERARIVIAISDDGAGFRADSLREAAIRARAVSADEANSLDRAALHNLAFVSGISTSPVISRISGHGLGLAIVREQVERVEGTVAIDTQPGRGSTIRLEVPATISTYRGLLVAVGGQLYLCPRDALDRAVGVPLAEVHDALSRGLLTLDGWSLPFARLGDLLGLEPEAEAGPAEGEARLLPAIALRSGARRGVVLVDAIHGDAEVIVKEFPQPIRRLNAVMSVGLLGTGDLALILRVTDLLDAWNRPRPMASAHGPRNRSGQSRALSILVVDDSLTTRAMERNLFETAGFNVRVAFDGLDAWEILQTEAVDLVVSDIDMPRMDGFTLTEKIRGHSRLADLPVVLVTALESREDKERGIRVGASAYVLKSGFDQSNLLDIVSRLI